MASGADGLIAKVFEGHITTMIIFAALFGALSPFCSCGVIPLIAALLAAGVPIPAVIAFWLSSPLIDPGKFILAISTLGIEFTLGLTAAAIAMGLYGGFLTRLVMVHGAFKNALKPRAGAGCCVVNTVTKSKDVIWNFWFSSERRAVFTTESIATALFLLKWLTLAFLLESLMLRYVPAETVATLLGNNSNLAIPIAALTGIPVYLNGYAALPLVQGLIKMGVVPGAGLAFLVAGAVTSIPAAIAVFAIVRISIFTWYVALALTGATLAGLLFQLYLG